MVDNRAGLGVTALSAEPLGAPSSCLATLLFPQARTLSPIFHTDGRHLRTRPASSHSYATHRHHACNILMCFQRSG
jgi:hypothetical protein